MLRYSSITVAQAFTYKGLQYIVKYDYIVELSVTVTFELDQLDLFIRSKSELHLFQEYPILVFLNHFRSIVIYESYLPHR